MYLFYVRKENRKYIERETLLNPNLNLIKHLSLLMALSVGFSARKCEQAQAGREHVVLERDEKIGTGRSRSLIGV